MKYCILLIAFAFFMCSTKKENKIKPVQYNCEDYFDKSIEFAQQRIADSAIYFIDKAIECSPKDLDYKFQKIKFLMADKEYDKAIQLTTDFINDEEPSFKMLEGILLLKMKKTNSEKILKDAYSDFSKLKNPTANDSFYKIALDNYFVDKNYAINQIQVYKKTYTSDFEQQNIEVLTELILKESKEEVLFSIFSIN